MDPEWSTLQCPKCTGLYGSRGERPPVCPRCDRRVGRSQWIVVRNVFDSARYEFTERDREWLASMKIALPKD